MCVCGGGEGRQEKMLDFFKSGCMYDVISDRCTKSNKESRSMKRYDSQDKKHRTSLIG